LIEGSRSALRALLCAALAVAFRPTAAGDAALASAGSHRQS
jgi:hypothetical protein